MSTESKPDTCPYCGTKLVPKEDIMTEEKFLRCENCHYKVSYAETK